MQFIDHLIAILLQMGYTQIFLMFMFCNKISFSIFFQIKLLSFLHVSVITILKQMLFNVKYFFSIYFIWILRLHPKWLYMEKMNGLWLIFCFIENNHSLYLCHCTQHPFLSQCLIWHNFPWTQTFWTLNLIAIQQSNNYQAVYVGEDEKSDTSNKWGYSHGLTSYDGGH